jgi:phosphotransferase system  glucose/maltose/N-acetylglucosamine-specific IIC component
MTAQTPVGGPSGEGAETPAAGAEGRTPPPLAPLGAHEHPPALRAAVAVCVLLGAGVIAGALSVHDLSRHGGSLPGAIFLAAVLLLLARGMHARRYWAVLGFEALLAFQLIVTSLALVVAATILAAAICAVGIGLGGWLFWKLVRVMGRIQAGERAARRIPQ